MKVIEHLRDAVRAAATYNSDVEVAPACILWPDKDRQFEAAIERLQAEMPELFVLGDYAPDERIGPAIWLRGVLAEEEMAGNATRVGESTYHTPVFYLPGVSRQDLRAVEDCPVSLEPLAELQFRGVIWSHGNGRDWTAFAYLKTAQGGLGLDMAQDNASKLAMQNAFARLLDEEIEQLKGKHLDKDFFNTLLTGGDPIRDLLRWLDHGDDFRDARSESEWNAFVEVCKSQFAFDPQNDGALAGAGKLAIHDGSWNAAWERFCEAPAHYPNIPDQIRRHGAPELTLEWNNADGSLDGWPQWNEFRESELQRNLRHLAEVAPHEARASLAQMEIDHGCRRNLVWAVLGLAPLARAIEHLAILAEVTTKSIAAGTVDDMATAYCDNGWKADDAVLRALACVQNNDDIAAVTNAIRAVYLPWAEDAARYLQKIVHVASYPEEDCTSTKPSSPNDGECILFVDGLRFDVGKRLAGMLTRAGFETTEKPTWAALPTVTATGKPAVSPVHDKIRGTDSNADFEPAVAETGVSLNGSYHLHKLLRENGWTVLDKHEVGDGTGRAWCEFGDLDHEGHNHGWQLPGAVKKILAEITERIKNLLAAGWKSVRIVTDHGWLLMPGGLPKTELSVWLTESKWGRCAAIKSGAKADERRFPWYWNTSLYFALADGVSCYCSGNEYAHGGLSLQECLTLQLVVSAGGSSASQSPVEITDVSWRGLRCSIIVDGGFPSLSMDIRTQPGNADTSVVAAVKPLTEDGNGSVVVANEELEGTAATIVLLTDDGRLIAQTMTTIGGGDA